MSSRLFDAPFLKENDDEDYDLVAAVCAAFLTRKRSRRLPPKRKRLDWKAHVKRLHKEGQFQRMYRMSYTSFCKLARLVKCYLMVNEKQSNRQSRGAGPISVEIILHCLIRYMAGGSHHDIRVAAGLAKSTFFYCLHRGIDAINKCSELALRFPTNLDELKRTALEFQGKSSFGVLDGCVGALDGWLCRIKVPLGKDTSNIRAYFSGHYQCYGVNVQAACDSRCRFTYLSCRSPGGTGDSRAFYGAALSNFLQEIPRGFYVVGDAAYTLSSSLLVPYTGGDKRNKHNDVFNFHLSQLRIKIEQAFGLLVNKWRVFKKALEINLKRVPALIECCMRLHNYCINERNVEWCIPDLSDDAVLDHVAQYEQYIDPLDEEGRAGGRNNVRARVREAIKTQLRSLGRERPTNNKVRNQIA
jgi:hypothetical protein